MNFVEIIVKEMGGDEKEVSLYVEHVLSCRIDNNMDIYVEKHHLLPRSVFPEYVDSEWNIFPLLPEDHFIAHKLLAKSTGNSTAICAFWAMANQVKRGAGRGKVAEKELYEVLPEDYSLSKQLWLEAMKGNQFSKGRDPWNKGMKLDQEYRDKLSDAHKGFVPERIYCPHCEESFAINIAKQYHLDKCSKLTGVRHSFPKVKCPHCDKEGGSNVMKRFHFEKCKFKK